MSAFAITVRVFQKKILRISLTVSIKLKKHIPTKTDPEQGSGFQLVKLVIDQHHGEIKAESSENGTVFTFSLKQALPPPRRQPAAE